MYKDGKDTYKSSSPQHLSFQNLTLPLPTSKDGLLSKRSHPFVIVFHIPTPHPILILQKCRLPSSFQYFPYNLFLESFPFGCKSPTPLSKKSLIKWWKRSNAQSSTIIHANNCPFHFSPCFSPLPYLFIGNLFRSSRASVWALRNGKGHIIDETHPTSYLEAW